VRRGGGQLGGPGRGSGRRGVALGWRSSWTGSTIMGTPACCRRRWMVKAVSLWRSRFQAVSSSKMIWPATKSAWGKRARSAVPSFSASTATSVPMA
jgi:hypothetical protein